MKVIIKNLQKKISINLPQIKRAVNCIEPPKKFNTITLSLYLVKNSEIKRLNNKFFHKNCFTDVISFLIEPQYAEVFIAPLVIKSNAIDFEVDFLQELYRCIIHGLLHIFGYRDSSRIEKKKMWVKQERLLNQILT